MSPPDRRRGGLRRRDFLVGAGAAAIALPFLRTLRAGGDPPPAPRRFVVFYTPGGMIPHRWAPRGGETDFTFSDILQPLEPHRQDLLILGGLRLAPASADPTGGGHNQTAHTLTSIRSTGGYRRPGASDPFVESAGGISVDQYIAQGIGRETPFRSLELAVQVKQPELGLARISYLGPHRPRDPDEDPFRAFARLFADVGKTPEELQRLHARRQSVLDFVRDDLTRVHDRLGSAERPRLQAHLESLRELELSLSARTDAACTPTPLGPAIDVQANDNYPLVLKAQIDLLVMALACGRTRVASLQCSNSANDSLYATWLGISEQHHNLQHDWPKSPEIEEMNVRLSRWFAEQFAYLVGRLKSIPEGGGSMLDNTVVFWANNLGEGSRHTDAPMPYVLAGRAGGALRPGRFLTYGSLAVEGDHPVTHGRLLVSLCNAMGVATNTFGDPTYSSGGPLDGLG